VHSLDAEGRDAHALRQAADWTSAFRPVVMLRRTHLVPSTAPSDVDLTDIAKAEGTNDITVSRGAPAAAKDHRHPPGH
jgi:hypothetical protein